jgi:tRNA threonylcarbamoyladenosine biosynthesis protein TsaE
MTRLISRSAEETREAGRRWGEAMVPGTVVGLTGPLGSGKTVFVQGVAEGLGIDEPVTSPTYTLIAEYRGTMPLYHMDLYRLAGPEEFAWLGTEEMLYGDGVCMVEWSERAGDGLPTDAYTVTIGIEEDGGRSIVIREGDS